MKWLLLSLTLVAVPLYAGDGDYLKVKPYPKYPSPGEGIERLVSISVSPRFPDDPKFNSLFLELASLSSELGAKSIPLHEANIVFETKHDGKAVEVAYSKSKYQNNESVKSRWAKVFQLVRELSIEQFNP